ncbi:unnamed protein product [Candida verbasci]|uniref:Uncharacterized protein n=1 Tax=Candida verbasci TaxID=1227364 RepID=A0A9W4X821_9ASCO|nr:unnamed protein product [Candida verbasci]
MRLHLKKTIVLVTICLVLILWKKKPVYSKIIKVSAKDHCSLLNIKQFDPLIYKRKKWIKDKTREARRLHKHDGYDYITEVNNEFNKLRKEQAEIEKSLIENLCRLKNCVTTETGEGRGIVILVENVENVKNVLRLVKVLNTGLPIEFIVKSEIEGLKQYGKVIKTDGSLLSAAIYNTFDEFLIVSEHVLPFEIEQVFEFDRFKETGVYLFKSPTILSNRVTKFKPGFHESASLIKKLVSGKGYTSRFFDLQFSNIMDQHLIAMKKSKVVPGLKIAEYMSNQDLIKLRVSGSDLIWLGLEISGIKVPFNYNHAVATGIYIDGEICSSSHGQVSDNDDVTLLYVTTYQLENSFNSKFRFLLERYKIKKTAHVSIFDKATSIDRIDTSVYSKVIKNPLVIENLIKPPILSRKVYVHSFDEPDEAWMLQKNNFNIFPYYCVYESIGDPLKEGSRGLTVNVDEELQKRYEQIVNKWLE